MHDKSKQLKALAMLSNISYYVEHCKSIINNPDAFKNSLVVISNQLRDIGKLINSEAIGLQEGDIILVKPKNTDTKVTAILLSTGSPRTVFCQNRLAVIDNDNSITHDIDILSVLHWSMVDTLNSLDNKETKEV